MAFLDPWQLPSCLLHNTEGVMSLPIYLKVGGGEGGEGGVLGGGGGGDGEGDGEIGGGIIPTKRLISSTSSFVAYSDPPPTAPTIGHVLLIVPFDQNRRHCLEPGAPRMMSASSLASSSVAPRATGARRASIAK